MMMTNKNFPDLQTFNKGQGECTFDEEMDVSADGQSYVVMVDLSNFTPQEGGWHFAVGLEVDSGETVEDTIRDLTVTLQDQNDIEIFCYPNEGFGHGTDIGCYSDNDKEKEPPMGLNFLEVKVVGVKLPMIKGLIYGGNNVCQGIILN